MDWLIPLLLPLSSYPQAAHLKNLLIDRHGFVEAQLPEALREQVFEHLFTTAEIACFTPDQVRSYEKSLKYYRDLKNSLDMAFDEGKEEGEERGKAAKQREIVSRGLKQGLDIQMIADLTGLSVEAIENIQRNLSR
ncbi:MAG: hypothetical protein D3922_03465 [Candidatus Electrothrix sp. AR1]|nr:hypothetical protein [Candidatus Electrothrix sp. AR1]